MPTLPHALIAASASIVLLLGLAHLWLTFRGTKLDPRDTALEARMRAVSPRLTQQTTMWKTWVGFNASHAFGATSFGLVYGYLGLAHGGFLFGSWFLLGLGLVQLLGYGFLGHRYWFSVPFRGILLATALYVAALVLGFS